MEKKLTVLFDDGCPTCTVMKNVSEKLDPAKALDFVGMNTERGKTMVHNHNLDMQKSAYAFHRDGSKTEKARMSRDVLAHNGFIGFVFSLPFRIPYMGDKFYELLALHRKHEMKK